MIENLLHNQEEPNQYESIVDAGLALRNEGARLALCSPGGAGSNYLSMHLSESLIMTDTASYSIQTCHNPTPPKEIPVLYLYRYLPDAIYSQYKRGLIRTNARKLLGNDAEKFDSFMRGELSIQPWIDQMANFLGDNSVFILQYGHWRDQWKEFCDFLGEKVPLPHEITPKKHEGELYEWLVATYEEKTDSK